MAQRKFCTKTVLSPSLFSAQTQIRSRRIAFKGVSPLIRPANLAECNVAVGRAEGKWAGGRASRPGSYREDSSLSVDLAQLTRMSAVVDPTLKSREEQDAELDRRIEALRKKNEALMRRHQEIEEDRKKAEEDGISVTTRRPKYEAEYDRRQNGKGVPAEAGDLSRSLPEKRMTNDRRARSGLGSPGRGGWAGNPTSPGPRASVDQAVHYSSPSRRPDRTLQTDRPELTSRGFAGPEGERRGRGRRGRGGRGGGGMDGGVPTGVSLQDRRVKEWEEKRRQNIEKMNEEMEKIAEYERGQMDGTGERNPTRNFLDDPRRLGSLPDGDRKGGSRRHVRNWGGPDFDKVKTGLDRGKDQRGRQSGAKDHGRMDMTLSMTGRERAEYMRWKKEREQIDQERLARHRNATGQWRREWDAEKTESMFKAQGSHPVEKSSPRDEHRPPKPPTISEFIFQSKSKDSRKGRVKHREKNYSMHDDRWETPEAEVEEKREEEELKAPSPKQSESKVHVDESPAEDDDDQWEDASDSEEEIVGEDVSEGEEAAEDLNEEKKKDGEGTKKQEAQSADQSPKVGAKDQRVKKSRETPRLHIKDEAENPADTESKPLSPFSLEGYHPVKDWAEEMEITSPRTNALQNPLQSASTGESSQDDIRANAESEPQVSPTDCDPPPSRVQAGQGSMATPEPGGVPLAAVPEQEAEAAADNTATTEAVPVEGEAGSRTEVSEHAGEAASETSRRTDCVEGNEPTSGAVRITSFETVD
ncbi:coiled-coil domain-containing protein 9 isoform X3 [Hypanus sabinus]|uniref:coiled-coil domain-containing protein 9 isoform X3 n=1 Tax=Hypanus sabinus TaxID=79690 RepID=UPI0028C505CD|nr:coiled-coil domain-containing protein 9 isoform X3 [Hypanus sabinus]